MQIILLRPTNRLFSDSLLSSVDIISIWAKLFNTPVSLCCYQPHPAITRQHQGTFHLDVAVCHFLTSQLSSRSQNPQRPKQRSQSSFSRHYPLLFRSVLPVLVNNHPGWQTWMTVDSITQGDGESLQRALTRNFSSVTLPGPLWGDQIHAGCFGAVWCLEIKSSLICSSCQAEEILTSWLIKSSVWKNFICGKTFSSLWYRVQSSFWLFVKWTIWVW